jgi:hypothetical protein
MRRSLLLIGVIGLMLVACSKEKKSPANTGSGQVLGSFDWDRSPSTLIVRLDTQSETASQPDRLNSIPPCTLWGDGRVVWSTFDETGAEQILEARVDETTMRTFLEDIINRGFYNWTSDLVPSDASNPVSESMTLYLYNEAHTVQKFNAWPQDSYTKILQNCQHLSSTPVLVLPKAGWISAYPIPLDSSMPNWRWPSSAPFTLQELAEKSQSRWLEGDLASYIWLNARRSHGRIQVIERNQAYQVAIVVPGYSREAASPPTSAP